MRLLSPHSPPWLYRQLERQIRRRSFTNSAGPIEEQALPSYHRRRYYPVRPGAVLNSRYRAIAKLGFGAHSTVWLAKDQAYVALKSRGSTTEIHRSEHYVTLKVCIQDGTSTSPIRNEIETLRHLAKSPREHPGSSYARFAKEIFEVEGPTGRHSCIVSTPQGCSLWALQSMFPEGKVPAEVVLYVVQRLLGCVNWLFCDCDIIHTGMYVARSLPKSMTHCCHRDHCSECPFGNER